MVGRQTSASPPSVTLHVDVTSLCLRRLGYEVGMTAPPHPTGVLVGNTLIDTCPGRTTAPATGCIHGLTEAGGDAPYFWDVSPRPGCAAEGGTPQDGS